MVQRPEGFRLHPAGQWRARRLRAYQRRRARRHVHPRRGPEGQFRGRHRARQAGRRQSSNGLIVGWIQHSPRPKILNERRLRERPLFFAPCVRALSPGLPPTMSLSAPPRAAAAPPTAPRPWREIIAPYAKPSGRHATTQLLNTGLPFLVIMAALFCGLDHGIWATLLLALPAAALVVRLFIIQHDCGHHSFFKSRRANDQLGRVIGVFTLTPYNFWRRSHARHHATSGNLDRRGTGDVNTLTVREYLSRPAGQRLLYRL